MTKHIVMFKFRDDVAPEVRQVAREAFKKVLKHCLQPFRLSVRCMWGSISMKTKSGIFV